jgi:hypothetical protein
LNWLVEIFSEKSDQAHLATILISALVAIFVVLLNQWFIARRSKRDLLVAKIEELFSASNEYIEACRELMDSLQKPDMEFPERFYDYPPGLVNKLNDSITKMQMVCGLYFRGEKFNPEDYYIWRMPIFNIAHKGISLPEGDAHMAYEDSLAHIRASRENLNEICKKLMKKYGH